MFKFSKLIFGLMPSSKYVQYRIDKLIEDVRSSAKIKLNLGCGEHPIQGMINIDLYSEKADVKLDVLNLSIYQDNSVDLIESHHLFEHLSFDDAKKALSEWSRVLKLGGGLIITCPNISHISLLWLFQTIKMLMGISVDRNYTEKMFYGPQNNAGMFHKAGYDHFSLKHLVESHNFSVDFLHTPYPIRPTPSILMIARKI